MRSVTAEHARRAQLQSVATIAIETVQQSRAWLTHNARLLIRRRLRTIVLFRVPSPAARVKTSKKLVSRLQLAHPHQCNATFPLNPKLPLPRLPPADAVMQLTTACT